MREEIEKIFERYEGLSKEALIRELTWFVEKAVRDAKYETVMSTMDKVRDAFGIGKSEEEGA